jgi:hypothetical protein
LSDELQYPAEPAERHNKAQQIGGHMPKIKLIPLQAAGDIFLQRLFQGRITAQHPQIGEHADLEDVFRGRSVEPLVEDATPLFQTAPPRRVLGHDATGTGRNADGNQTVDQDGAELLQPLNVRRGEVVAIDQRIVLVGGQSLLTPPFAPQHHKGKLFGQIGPALRAQQIDQTDHNPVIEMGDQPHHIPDMDPAADQVLD